jgi:formylglycine-generating enzyme required for sulfatase activity
MTGTKINPALKFIQTAGVAGFVSGVQEGIIYTDQATRVVRSVGSAIDCYVEAMPRDNSLKVLREAIGTLSPKRDVPAKPLDTILDMLYTNRERVDLAVRFAFAAVRVGANPEAPFYLGDEWCWIPPGEFQMGSRNDDQYAYNDEKPLKTVLTGGFFMLDHPATNAEFKEFLKATVHYDIRNISSKFAGGNQPAVVVNHKQATAYSKWLGEEVTKRTGHAVIGRLPTEAEWEKAAKGPSRNEFIEPATSDQAHFDARATRSVNHPDAYANGYGLKDMIGNVWEWTSSPLENTPDFALRGASWCDGLAHGMRAAYRNFHDPGICDLNFGFRPILVPQDSEE